MPSSTSKHYASWVDLVWQYLHGPPGDLPIDAFTAAFDETFDLNLAAYVWGDAARGVYGSRNDRVIDGFPSDEMMERLPQLMRLHPLPHWFDRTQDPRPTTLDRVPREAVPAGGHDFVKDLLGGIGIDNQLSIPCDLGPGTYRAFVMSRPDLFSDEDLELATRIQPLLALAHLQAQTFSATPTEPEVRLTGRELAVLRLLDQGGTAQRIGHQLGISVHTVSTHLNNIYRKLEADGRVQALFVARGLGLLESSAPDRHPCNGAVRFDWSLR